MADLTMYRGDGKTLTIALTAGDEFVAGDVVRFTAKRSARDADADAVIAKSSDDGSIIYVAGASTATVRISPADTNDLANTTVLVYDVEVTPAAGDPETVDSGKLVIRADITRGA